MKQKMFDVNDIIYPKSKKQEGNQTNDDENGYTEINITPQEQQMLNRIAESKAVVKSQQVDEDEMQVAEKLKHLTQLYHKSKLSLLRRFGNYMNSGDLKLFTATANDGEDYETEFYVKKYRTFLDPARKEVVVKNRRYNYLQRVLKQSDYFNDSEIEKRHPLLYQQYIGQYTDDDGEGGKGSQPENFSQYLLNSIDRSLVNFQCELEKKVQEEQEEEVDEEDEEEEEEEEEEAERIKVKRNNKKNAKNIRKEVPLETDEKQRLREEFLSLMEQYFIDGRDNFDYDLVDRDEQYDDMEDQDLEDRYFDEEVAD